LPIRLRKNVRKQDIGQQEEEQIFHGYKISKNPPVTERRKDG
jgi:hypothetical protein